MTDQNQKLTVELQDMVRQRDELLAALKELVSEARDWESASLQAARAAIAGLLQE